MTSDAPVSLEATQAILGWPAREEVMRPPGASAAVFASLAREKIGRALGRSGAMSSATVGVLMPDARAAITESPLAVVVEFQSEADELTLRQLHRLCWNFSHSPALITLEPGLLRVWSCCEPPDPERGLHEFLVHRLAPTDLAGEGTAFLENRAAQVLHWINLVSGEFFASHATRFDRDRRADQMLLGNLRYLREKLIQQGLLDDDVCHDLIARIIFVQFLFDRKDSNGKAALDAHRLAALHAEGILHRAHADFASILSDYEDTYHLFDWLNDRFNGDLFPGKGNTPAARAQGWAKEKKTVTREHLALLAQFIHGDIDMPTGQGCLWPQYSFDVIPLEFISSIYEAFITEREGRNGIYYTPPHLVDFVLDRVLPWNGQVWDLRVLDPACGSGIFLVKAYQRLIHRWKNANPNQPVRTEILKRLLERNLLGVDKDPHAVRVACFSLYLAMCDEIDPRHYWTQIVFPPMRERRLICSDFFLEGRDGFDSEQSAGGYDLVVGNAPWGDSLVTQQARSWASAAGRKWTIANKDIGGLFLAKSACLLKSGARIAMIQSANSLLFNASRTATAFRKELFTTHGVEEIYNLSALRFKVFNEKRHTTRSSVAPACVVVMRPEKPSEDDRIAYVSPKRPKPFVDEFSIAIEPEDRHWLTVRDAASDASVWATLMWGSPRDRFLVNRLRRYPALASLAEEYGVKTREGIIIGDHQKSEPQLRGRRLFAARSFPQESLLYLDADRLPLADQIRTHSRDSTDFSAFAWPQLLIKQSWQKSSGRFSARLVRSRHAQGVICTQSYISVHASTSVLEAACMLFNSMTAVYLLQLTSGRMAAYRPEAQVSELLSLPLLEPESAVLEGVRTYADIDKRVFDKLQLKDAERVLIEDMFNYTLPDFRGDGKSPGRQPTCPPQGDPHEEHLTAYCEYFIRVLKAGFGQDKPLAATIFRTLDNSPLPYRLVAFQLGGGAKPRVEIRNIRSASLLRELERLDRGSPDLGGVRRGIYNQRVARIYDSSTGRPTVFMVKPDAARYWTRSAALNDGDEVALDLFRWQQTPLREAAPQ